MGAQNVMRLFNFAVGGGSPITATSDGLTTGVIPPGYGMVVVTSSSANDQISLPQNVVGAVIRIITGGTGCELVAVDAAATVNNVVGGATNELALTASSLFHCVCTSATAWIVRGFDNVGADLAALVPDGR